MEENHPNFLQPEEWQKPPENHSKKWRVFFVFSIIIFLVASFWTAKIIWGNEVSNDPEAYDPITLEPKKPEGFLKSVTNLVFTKNYELKGYNEDRINLLLFGIGGAGHDGPYLTDTIILASIKPSTGQVALLSIPRDLSVNIPGYGTNKINAAATYGQNQGKNGPAFAASLIADTFDIDIPYYTQVDFKAFSEIVDFVGGIKINVERSFVDEMYPAANNAYQTVSFKTGNQTMNGDTALLYARSRHGNNGEGSDFARAKRQQKVIFALKEKVLSAGTLTNPVRISKIISSLQTHIQTNLEFSDIMYFLKLVRELEIKEVITGVLDDSANGFLKPGFTAGGAYVLEPKTGTFDNIKDYIKNIFEKGEVKIDDTPEQPIVPIPKDISDAKIEIQNGTWTVGLAARLRKSLENKGFVISTVGNSETRPQADSGIYNLTNKDLNVIITDLQRELHLTSKTGLPAGVTATSTTDILILLGEDYTE